ncbi:MAG: hypothetical protein JNM79_01910 [Burkholderiales bacterium]|nr:hypothetical protein [Burkholderiales bacterium]
MLAACVCLAGYASESPFAAAYPPGSIDSVAKADAAISAARDERNAQFARDARARLLCRDQFLAERCLVAAREANDAAVRRIQAVDLEAREFLRRDRARQQAAARAARQAEEVSSVPERSASGAARSRDLEQRQAESLKRREEFERAAPERAAQAKRAEEEAARRAERARRRAADDQAAAPERAKRASEVAAKREAAIKRAAQREARENERAAERARKAAAARAKAPPEQ